MTEERIKELMGIWGEKNPKVIARACLIAAESRKEGIEEAYQEAKRVAQEWWDAASAIAFVDLLSAWKEAAERLKEQR